MTDRRKPTSEPYRVPTGLRIDWTDGPPAATVPPQPDILGCGGPLLNAMKAGEPVLVDGRRMRVTRVEFNGGEYFALGDRPVVTVSAAFEAFREA